ncbi:hypothetical protein JL722_1681 [Aureococcus anophagefferens]|nr:hypothetical protein JL722_1681 [Aureococcus anophagefferens]
MPVKADYKRAKKVSVLEGLEEMRAEAAKKAAAEAALPKFKKFDPQYAEASLRGVRRRPARARLAAGLRPVEPGAHLELAERKAAGNKDWGPSVFERDSPRARATLRTFLCDFLVDDARGNVRVRKDIDLRAYAREAMREVTNATVQEICVMQPAMTSLDVTDCHLVTDAALWAVSRHCKELRTLVASGCGQITRRLTAMTLGCPLVQRLELSRCASLDDPALSAIAAGFPHLVSLTVSECDHITDDGLAVLASGCRDLEHVDVSGCPRLGEFGDRALLALGRFCGRLERLDMFGCAHVQDAGIIAVARGCGGLEKLRLTGCRELTGGALAALARQCPNLVDLSIAGCERIKDEDLCKLVGQSGAVDLQRSGGPHWQGGRAAAFGGGERHAVGNLARHHRVARGVTSLTKLDVSACGDVRARGLRAIAESSGSACGTSTSRTARSSRSGRRAIGRSVTGLARLNVTGCRAVGRRFLLDLIDELQFCDLARDYVGYQPKLDANALRLEAERVARNTRAAITVQALWRGALRRIGLGAYRRRVYVERCVTRLQAAYRACVWRRVAAATLQDREAKAATWFSSAWRACKARRVIAGWRAEAREAVALTRGAVVVQRHVRGHRAKQRIEAFRSAVEAKKLDAARIRARYELKAAVLQAAWRGHMARTLRLLEIKRLAATSIQAAWRASRARYLATMAASLDALRAMEKIAVVRIQACARAMFAKQRANALRVARADAVREAAASLTIQRVLRGHYGRTSWEVQRRLIALQDNARPLYARLTVLRDESRQAAEDRDLAVAAHEKYAKETREVEAELREVSRVGHPTWDTARITGGYPQRYVTSYLKARLVEVLSDRRARTKEYEDLARERTISARDKERLIREALARGGIYRDAMARLLQCGPDQWEIHGCELSGEDYYFNAITRISRWTKPVELDFDIVPDARARLVRGRLGEIAKAAEENYGQLGFPDDIETVETSQEPYDARRPPPSKSTCTNAD